MRARRAFNAARCLDVTHEARRRTTRDVRGHAMRPRRASNVVNRMNPISFPFLLLCIAALLAGCASSTRPEAPLAPPPRATDDAAYVPAKHTLGAPTAATWSIGGEEFDVTLLAPAERGPFPLVLYLPGLGESSAAGAAWRRTWAEAGYAVVSAQSRATGTGVWASERVRSFDFRSIALEHFAPAVAAHHAARVAALLDEIARRQRTADAPEARIDLSRVAIAGYDLGAMLAMVLAGQHVADRPPAALPASVRSVIALSPYADFSGMATESRFRDVRLPVLSVTSPEDTDAYGLVTTAAVRRAPFQYMPPGRKYLLLLGAGPHSLLGGQERPPEERDARGAMRRPDGAFASGDRTGRDARGMRGRGDAAVSTQPVVAQPNPGAAWATQLRNVQGVTTAFLDATVRENVRAIQWLERDATRWLAGSASLQVK
jgi:hypothetical protein